MEVRLVMLNGGGFVLYGPGERAQGFSDLGELVDELKILVADEMVRVHAAAPVGEPFGDPPPGAAVRPPPAAPAEWFPRPKSSGHVLLSDPTQFADQPVRWAHRGVEIEPGDQVTWAGVNGPVTGTFKCLSHNLSHAVMDNGMIAEMGQIRGVEKAGKAPGAR